MEHLVEHLVEHFEFLSHQLFSDSPNLKLLKELPFYGELKFYNASEDLIITPSAYVRDLGVFVDEKLSWVVHYNTICRKAKQLCGWILHTFSARDQVTLLTLFKSLVRSNLEFCCEVWNPHLNKDIVSIEQIQRSFTSRILEVKDLNYWERLKKTKFDVTPTSQRNVSNTPYVEN